MGIPLPDPNPRFDQPLLNHLVGFRKSNDCGIVMPSAFAVFRLIVR